MALKFVIIVVETGLLTTTLAAAVGGINTSAVHIEIIVYHVITAALFAQALLALLLITLRLQEVIILCRRCRGRRLFESRNWKGSNLMKNECKSYEIG